MKERALILLLCLLVLCSCSTISFERKVEGNTFFSMADPRVRVNVNPGFRYIGEVAMARRHQNVQGARNLLVNNNSYVFAEIGQDNSLTKGVVIRVDKVNRSSWQPDLFSDIKNKLVTDYEQIGAERYEHFIAVRSDIFTPDEMDFIIAQGMKNAGPAILGERLSYSGYRIPKCFMVEAFGIRAGASNDTKLCIYYFEDLARLDEQYPCREWIRDDLPPAGREPVVKRFVESRKRGLSFAENVK
ncbi:MAG: hypothetical protein WDA72_12555 [Desulfomonilia bacterium]|nr:hypothetical protein [Deltaproteobacteria bacterium]MDX9760942.1 hypothetical protein [Desulfomonilia bacterium]HPW67887.1 hypothetical protein [Deltaproteobacteria bacterium]